LSDDPQSPLAAHAEAAAGSETVRVYCSDGYFFEVAMPVPWDMYIQNMLTVGGLWHANMFINRQYIVRIVRWPQSGGMPPDASEDQRVVMLRPVK
jgi:hypothetical protein